MEREAEDDDPEDRGGVDEFAGGFDGVVIGLV